jgi:hypothetical protein
MSEEIDLDAIEARAAAATRTDIPALCREVRRLRARLAEATDG